jgi:hypothetical protein
MQICFSSTGRSCDLGIPKLVCRVSSGQLVHSREIFDSRVSEFRRPDELNGSDLESLSNTPKEILELAHESVLRYEKHGLIQRLFQSLFDSMLSYGSYSFRTPANCRRMRMRKYQDFIR